MKYAFIQTQTDSHTVTALCRALEVSRSGYNDWLSRGRGSRADSDAALAARIRVVHAQSRGAYGSPRVTAALQGQGERVNEKRVARVMRDNAIRGRARQKYRATTDSSHGLPVAKNVLKRRFNPPQANRVWASDITAIRTDEGWLYLAVVIDLCTRQVVGFSQAEHMRAQLVHEAFLMAYWRYKPPKGLLFHSDRGSQYCERAFRKLLKGLGIKQSMSRKGNCWDNAVSESFFRSLKVEEVFERRYATRREAKAAIGNYILGFYNPVRLHSTLGYQSPNAFARSLAKQA